MRKISLKVTCKLTIKIETVPSCPCNTCFDTLSRWLQEMRHSTAPRDVFLTASARAYQKHVLHGQETVSIFIANLHAILTIFYARKHGTLLYRGLRQ